MKNIFNKIKMNYKKIILIVLVSIAVIATGIYILNRNGAIEFSGKFAISNNKANKNDKKLKEYGLTNVNGVYTFNVKLEDFIEKLKADYKNLYSENYSVRISEDSDGWYSLILGSTKEYIGGNKYYMEAKNKLFKTTLLQNDYIKEIELSYNTTTEGGPTDVTFVLYKDFTELSGLKLNETSNEKSYIEFKQNILGSITSYDDHWQYSDFDLAIQFASPGSVLYGLPRNRKFSQNGISYDIKVTEEYDTEKCNNKSFKSQNKTNNVENKLNYIQQTTQRRK